MKKILSMLLSALLVFTLVPPVAVFATTEETGGTTPAVVSDDVTYVDVANYDAFIAQISNGTISNSIRLTGDVDFGGNTISAELATLADGVVINGNGYSFKNFKMSAAATDMALFAIAEGATVTIKNLTIGSAEEGGEIEYTLTSADGKSSAILVAVLAEGTTLNVANMNIYAKLTRSGGSEAKNSSCSAFVGYAAGVLNVRNCNFTGSILYQSGVGTYPNVAGFVGTATATSELSFNNCTNDATIKGQQRASGFVAKLESKTLTMTNCTNNGDVSGCYMVSGFIGEMLPTTNSTTYTISNCENNGNVSGSKYLAGGFIAKAEFIDKAAKLLIEKSINAGNVTAQTAKSTTLGQDPGTGTGGFIGSARANKSEGIQIEYCVNNGDITNTKDMTGGIIGFVFTKNTAGSLNIEHTINAGIIKGGCFAGGMIGGFYKWSMIKIEECINIGDITCAGGYVGPLIGAHQDIVAQTKKNTDHYALYGSGYLCTLDNSVDGGTNDDTKINIGAYKASDDKGVSLSKYENEKAALAAINGVAYSNDKKTNVDLCQVGSFTLDENNSFVFIENPKFVGLQVSESYSDENNNSVFDVRFVAVLENENYDLYSEVGFVLVADDGNGEVTHTIAEKRVYSSITAGNKGGMKTYGASELGGNYISALAIEGVPASGTATFKITAYAKDLNGVELSDVSTYEVVFENGVCASLDLVID